MNAIIRCTKASDENNAIWKSYHKMEDGWEENLSVFCRLGTIESLSLLHRK